MHLGKLLTRTAVSLSVFALSAVPALASTDIVITGNGKDSSSGVSVVQNQATVVSQSNTTSVSNSVSSTSSTGGNKISGSTGGSSTVTTGAADTQTTIVNTLNSNVGTVSGCDSCQTPDVAVNIADNGAGSGNSVKTGLGSLTLLDQDNTASIKNTVLSAAVTGDNQVKNNTNGDVLVQTGMATVGVDVNNQVNGNTGSINGGDSAPGVLGATIQHNGVDSVNKITASVNKAVVLDQSNQTNLKNLVAGDALTGENKAKGTTGGSTTILTGPADVQIDVVNQAGFNQAAVGCDCLSFNVQAKIKDNGKDSKSGISAGLASVLTVKQVNTCGIAKPSLWSFLMPFNFRGQDCVTNALNGNAQTGLNVVSGSTQGSDNDPLLVTGSSSVVIYSQTTGGSNTYPYSEF